VPHQIKELFVSPDGNDDSPGTFEQPLATLSVAQRKTREYISTMQADIVINLRAGTHQLTSPLELTAESDAGLNGYRVIYQAHGYGTDAQEKVIVSGGREITNWHLHDADKNIWMTEIGAAKTRQLFINDKRAARATLKDIPESFVQTASGYDVNNTEPLAWGNAADLEFVYTGIYPWSEARIGVDTTKTNRESTSILMKQPAFEWASSLYKSKVTASDGRNSVSEDGLSRPTHIENGLGFLKEPGTFVFDSSKPGTHRLYYIPRADEDMSTVRVVIPVLETLIHGRGTENTPLRNIAFRGLMFAHATWQQPSGPNGFLHYHGATYYTGGGVQKIPLSEESWVTVPSASEFTPSALTFEHARAITFENNRFVHFGTGGLEFTAGCSFNTVTGNIFEDISATAITLGNTAADKIPSQETKHNHLENNWLHHTGCEYHGAPAVLLVEAQHTVVTHNQINDVPHSGIVAYGNNSTRATKITNNLVFNSVGVLADGGGINLAGTQGTSYEDGAVVSGNVIHDVLTSYNFGLYTDYGTAWTKIENNIIYRADTPVVLDVTPPLRNVIFKGNFWDKVPIKYDKPPETVVVADNTVLASETIEAAIQHNPAAKHIAQQAGIEHNHPLHKEVR
jgi:hypothetical protein